MCSKLHLSTIQLHIEQTAGVRRGSSSNGFNTSRTENNHASQGQQLALTGLFSPSVLNSNGFSVQGSGVRVQDSGFGVQGSGFKVQGRGGHITSAPEKFWRTPKYLEAIQPQVQAIQVHVDKFVNFFKKQGIARIS